MAKPVLGCMGHIDPEIFVDMFNLKVIHKTEDLRGTHAVLFGGGTDVSPRLYGERVGRYTDHPDDNRDNFETQCFLECDYDGRPMIGICRGSQFLTVMVGGSLVQHVTGHAVGKCHDIVTHDGRQLRVNSFHHQMMKPPKSHDRYSVHVLAKTPNNLSNVYLNGDNVNSPVDIEPEVVLYAGLEGTGRSNILCIQGHPEYPAYLQDGPDFLNYTLELTKKHIIDEKGFE